MCLFRFLSQKKAKTFLQTRISKFIQETIIIFIGLHLANFKKSDEHTFMKLLFLFLLFSTSHIAPAKSADIVGHSISKSKDLKIEVFEKEGKFYGKMVWFEIYEKDKTMNDFKDNKNPSPSLRNRQWKDMVVMTDLRFNNEGYWSEGKIYDPNSGHTFSSLVKITSPGSITVRGFLGFEILGKSLEFTKVM